MKGELLGYLEMKKIQTKITLGFYFVLFRIRPIFNLACKDIFFWKVQVHPMPLRYIQENKPGRIMLGHQPGIFHRKRFFSKENTGSLTLHPVRWKLQLTQQKFNLINPTFLFIIFFICGLSYEIYSLGAKLLWFF